MCSHRLSCSIGWPLADFCRQADNRSTLRSVTSPVRREAPRVAQASGELLLRGLRLCELFRGWEPTLLEEVAASARLQRHPRNGQLTQAELFVVVSGSIEVSGFNAQGEKFMLHVFGPGEITGLFTLVGDVGHRNYNYLVRQESCLVHLSSAALRTVLDNNPIHWRGVAMMALTRNEKNIIQMERRALASISQRVAQAIMRLAQLSGRVGQHGEVKLRISQSDLAAMASVSRQTANQELGVFARKGIIAVKYSEVTILDMGALRAEVAPQI